MCSGRLPLADGLIGKHIKLAQCEWQVQTITQFDLRLLLNMHSMGGSHDNHTI